MIEQARVAAGPQAFVTAASQRGIAALLRRVAVVPVALAAAVVPDAASAETLNLSAFTDVARRCGSSVAAHTLAAIAKTESGFRTLVVNDNTTHRSATYATVDIAEGVANRLIAGGHSVDVGLMQINSTNFRRLGMTARDALDACRAVSAGARILTGNYRMAPAGRDPQVALRDALSRYNTGNPRSGYRNGYVRRVEAAARSLLPAMMAAVNPGTAPVAMARLGREVPFANTGRGPGWWDVWSKVGRNFRPASALTTNKVMVF